MASNAILLGYEEANIGYIFLMFVKFWNFENNWKETWGWKTQLRQAELSLEGNWILTTPWD